jgi:hypothetical protein
VITEACRAWFDSSSSLGGRSDLSRRYYYFWMERPEGSGH